MSFKSMSNQPPPRKKYELKTLAQCWQEFSEQVIPADAGRVEVERARMVFYSGAAFFYDQTMAIGEPSVGEDAGEQHLMNLSQELRDYRKSLEEKVARLFPPMGRA